MAEKPIDDIIDKPNLGKQIYGIDPDVFWGEVVDEDNDTCFFANGRIAKKKNEGKKWVIRESPEVIRRATFETVAKLNAKFSSIVPSETDFYLLKMSWVEDESFKPIPFGMSATFSVVISARTKEEAFDFMKKQPTGDSFHYWNDIRYLVFELVGKSFINEVRIICKDHRADSG